MTTPDVPPIALAGEPPICDVIDVLFSQKAAWTSELGYAINSSDFRHLLEKTGGIHAPTPSASSVPVAWVVDSDGFIFYQSERPAKVYEPCSPLYAAPPTHPAPSVLTDEHEAFESMLQREDYGSNAGTRQGEGYKYSTIDDMWRGWLSRALLQANGATK